MIGSVGQASGQTLLVSKRELCLVLRISRPTLDSWIDRWGPEFPIVERGGNGTGYKFDPQAVTAFLRGKQAEQAALQTSLRAERDEQLAQFMLPLPAQEQPSSAVSLDDQLKAERLNVIRLEAARKAGELVSAAEVSERLAAAFAAFGRNQQAFARSLGREHGWPEAIVRATEQRLAEMLRSAVREATNELAHGRGDDEEPRLALG